MDLNVRKILTFVFNCAPCPHLLLLVLISSAGLVPISIKRYLTNSGQYLRLIERMNISRQFESALATPSCKNTLKNCLEIPSYELEYCSKINIRNTKENFKISVVLESQECICPGGELANDKATDSFLS